MKKIPVMEIFGPTIQGEGMVIGRKTMFVRTGGCDYRCSWCDSAFTWDGSGKSELLHAEQIVERLEVCGGERFDHVTISGGNPALHKGIAELVALLEQRKVKTAVETQGSIWQDWLLDITDVTISPKPPSSKMDTDFAKLDDFVGKLDERQMSLKVVVFDEEDFAYACDVHLRYPNVPFYLQVGNADTHTSDQETLLQRSLHRYEWLIEKAMDEPIMNDARVLPQLHTFLWGNKRGV
ncbi:7-carboxy-7-deazaguanine synthase QueE [Shouchella shacheensis]|uniref:7-carboxy-7-deazaguanine synthase QueE n=1 Tax=Shouchella shacheensis TaxID=1649580 RepID=UPI00073FCC87|nr:7-carboxy-7-deazaguanine synthase QueE [Shouchella shacheensis]